MTEPASPSLQRNSIARLASDAVRLLVGLVSVTLTARWLGPSQKGTLSALLYVSVLLTYASSLGLGDASIVLIGKGSSTFQEAVSKSLLPAFMASLLAVGVLWTVALIAHWSAIYSAIAVMSIVIPLATVAYILVALENSRERLVFTSAVAALQATLETVCLFLFVFVLGLGILGGVLSALAASTLSVVLLVREVRNAGASLRFRFDSSYLKRALVLGIKIEGGFLLVALSQRLDLLLVYSWAGEKPAGVYAIALTVSGIAAFAPGALTAAAFPRLAMVDEAEAEDLTSRILRLVLTAGMAVGFLLAALAPISIPALFGPEFAGAVGPTMVLLVGSVFWSVQWALARAAAAKGATGIYVASFASSLLTMVMLDLFLVPRLGSMGAAVGAAGASFCGVLVCSIWYVRNRGIRVLRTFLPTMSEMADIKALVESVRKT